jgi:hypothetical protein
MMLEERGDASGAGRELARGKVGRERQGAAIGEAIRSAPPSFTKPTMMRSALSGSVVWAVADRAMMAGAASRRARRRIVNSMARCRRSACVRATP